MSRVTLYITEKEGVKSVEDGSASVRVHRDGRARPLQAPAGVGFSGGDMAGFV